MGASNRQRLAVYIDCPFVIVGEEVFAAEAFVCFLGALARECGGLRLLGREDSGGTPARFRLDPAIEFVPLPAYPVLTDVVSVIRSLPRTFAGLWRALDDADTALSLGPQPYAIAFALMAMVRRRKRVLGARQDFPAYVRHRYTGRPGIHLAARALEAVWRILARTSRVVAVGPELAQHYSRSPSVLETAISLIHTAEVEAGARAAQVRSYDAADLTLLTVGRIDAEKNPLLLPEILAALRQRDPRWRLIVCGEGNLITELARRIRQRGLAPFCELRGYVPLDRGLLDLYRRSHAFVHVSLTEGLPQVLFEAYASGLPSVATAVGGVRALAGCSLLVAPQDAAAAAQAVQRLVDDPALRERLIAAGLQRAARHTIEIQAAEVARFIAV